MSSRRIIEPDNDEVDPIFFQSSCYVAAEENTAKLSLLFMAALTNTNQNAIAKIAMHNREHIVLLRPSGGSLVLHTLSLTRQGPCQASRGAFRPTRLQGYIPREG
jgi:non-homologous end joining protein Ku